MATYPQSYRFASVMAYKLHRSDQEYFYDRIRIEKNIQSGTDDYLEEGIVRLAALGTTVADKRGEIRYLLMHCAETFRKDTALNLTVCEALTDLGFHHDASTLLEKITISPADSILSRRNDVLRRILKPPGSGIQ
jgi:hypothetical protein